MLSFISQIETVEQEKEFCKLLRALLDDHRDVVTLLAEGFKECKRHITVSYLLSINILSRKGNV